MGSHHVNAAFDFDEANPGLFLGWDGATLTLPWGEVEVDGLAGVYHNSYGRTSLALLAEVPLAAWEGGGLSLLTGAVRYPEDAQFYPVHVGDWMPFGALQVRQGWLDVQLIPGDGVSSDAVIAFGVTFDLGQGW